MKYLKYMLMGACFAAASCSDFLEEYSQDTYYVTSWQDLDELLVGDCYLPVHAAQYLVSTSDPGFFIHFLADEIEEQNEGQYGPYDGDKPRAFGYYTWQPRNGQTPTYTGYTSENGTWTEIYRLINVANNIIESAGDVPQALEEEKQGVTRVSGEAHFIRAAYYFWLVNLYGKPYRPATADTDLGVPLKTDPKVNDIIYARNTVQEVYDLVVADLQLAERNLSLTGKAKSIYRADSTAAQLLLSRVYLYMQDWDKAAAYADKVLKARPGLRDLNGMQGKFLTKTSTENIFSMGGSETCCYMANYYNFFRVARELYDCYEADDLRKKSWYWTYNSFIGITKLPCADSYVGDENATDDGFYASAYYYGRQGTRSDVSDKFLFRTAEAYLIKAEAEAYRGNESEARAALNELRRHRYLSGSAYEVTATGEALVKAIRDERRRELALEGHRWFDLRRYGVCGMYPESKRIVHDYTYYDDSYPPQMVERRRFVLEANDLGYTLPIPYEVLDYNTGMPNNEQPDRNYVVVPIN